MLLPLVAAGFVQLSCHSTPPWMRKSLLSFIRFRGWRIISFLKGDGIHWIAMSLGILQVDAFVDLFVYVDMLFPSNDVASRIAVNFIYDLGYFSNLLDECVRPNVFIIWRCELPWKRMHFYNYSGIQVKPLRVHPPRAGLPAFQHSIRSEVMIRTHCAWDVELGLKMARLGW